MTTTHDPITKSRANNAEQLLQAAQDLHGPIRAAVPEMQTNRTLTPAVVDAMRDAEVFAMALPRSLGGPELSPLEQLRIIETLSYADASVGWCAMIGCDFGLLPRLPRRRHRRRTVSHAQPRVGGQGPAQRTGPSFHRRLARHRAMGTSGAARPMPTASSAVFSSTTNPVNC